MKWCCSDCWLGCTCCVHPDPKREDVAKVARRIGCATGRFRQYPLAKLDQALYPKRVGVRFHVNPFAGHTRKQWTTRKSLHPNGDQCTHFTTLRSHPWPHRRRTDVPPTQPRLLPSLHVSLRPHPPVSPFLLIFYPLLALIWASTATQALHAPPLPSFFSFDFSLPSGPSHPPLIQSNRHLQ